MNNFNLTFSQSRKLIRWLNQEETKLFAEFAKAQSKAFLEEAREPVRGGIDGIANQQQLLGASRESEMLLPRFQEVIQQTIKKNEDLLWTKKTKKTLIRT